TPYDYFFRAAEAVASSIGIEPVPSRVSNAAEIEHTISLFSRSPNSGLVLLPDPTSTLHLDLIVTTTARYRLPAVYPNRFFVDAGGLMCYDNDRIDLYRRAANYVDGILRGALPAELPVQAPTKYATIINLRTAKALGLRVPASLLVAADEVIE